MSIKSKSYDKSLENSKNGNPYYCRGGKIYNDPQLLTKRKVIQFITLSWSVDCSFFCTFYIVQILHLGIFVD